MMPHLHDADVIRFLLLSLRRNEMGTYRWCFDLRGLKAAYPALLAAPLGEQTYNGPVLFIKGGASDYIGEQHWPAIRALFPAASIRTMPDCGHWLHAEKPRLFNAIVTRFLETVEHPVQASARAGQER